MRTNEMGRAKPINELRNARPFQNKIFAPDKIPIGGHIVSPFERLITTRHSVRQFQPREVEPEKIRAILEAGRRAPSAGNAQSYDIVVVVSPEAKQSLMSAAFGQRFVGAAPLVIVVLIDMAKCSQMAETEGRRFGDAVVSVHKPRNHIICEQQRLSILAVQNATIAINYMDLQAVELGLGTCWVSAFDMDKVAQIVGAEGHHLAINILCIGYPNEKPGKARAPRRELEDLVTVLGEVGGQRVPYRE